jgi:hypothetical protein
MLRENIVENNVQRGLEIIDEMFESLLTTTVLP